MAPFPPSAATLSHLIMITLVEIAAVFWVAAQLWTMFVLQLAPSHDPHLRTINEQVQQRFERRWSLPTLLVLLLANVGALVGQALTITGGQWVSAFAPSLLSGLASSGRFGTYWLMREIVVIVAIAVAIYMLLSKK